jgi:hypothetical protein
MHLPGEAHAGNVLAAQLALFESFADGRATRFPPVFRMLFGPADLGRGERLVLRCGGGDEPSLLVNNDRARSSGANVDA